MAQIKVSEYEQQANDFLAKFEITFSAELIGKDCPKYCEDATASRDMDKLDTFPRKTHIHGKHYRCTFQRNGHMPNHRHANGYMGSISIDFWNSYADEEWNTLGSKSYRLGETIFKYGERKRSGLQVKGEKGKQTPQAYDVLACLTKSDPGSFDDFCGDYGYSSDSMRAHEIWVAVRAEWRKVESFFYSQELEEMQQIQ